MPRILDPKSTARLRKMQATLASFARHSVRAMCVCMRGCGPCLASVPNGAVCFDFSYWSAAGHVARSRRSVAVDAKLKTSILHARATVRRRNNDERRLSYGAERAR